VGVTSASQPGPSQQLQKKELNITPFAAQELDRETELQAKFLHLREDFSQLAISRHMSENSSDISNRYFQNRTASSNPPWSAS
jgi:hypothetical protein